MNFKINNISLIFSLMLLVSLFSCRTENDLSIDPPEEATIAPNSTIANLMARVATNDGSDDNIIDKASNLLIQLPITVVANGIELEIIDSNAFEVIEDIYNQSNDDVDELVISYPITVILTDYTNVIVNSDAELTTLRGDNMENENDEDIECIDFIYPITMFVFDEENDEINSIIIENDFELYVFIEDLNTLAAVTLEFPITVQYANEETQIVNNIQELENEISAADDTCDEDDDNDYDECGSNNYTIPELEDILDECSVWTIDKLNRDGSDLVSTVANYEFTFNNDGTISIIEGANNFTGTWTANGSQGDINMTINSGDVPVINDSWNLCYINEESNDRKIELKLGTDRLRFVSTCEDDVIVTICDNPQPIALPFRMVDVAGDYCWEVSETVLYFNSWGVDYMEINGEDFTNQWIDMSLPNFPEAIDGKYYVRYIASNAIGAGVDIGLEYPDHVICTDPTEINLPFSFEGVGVYCWVTSEDISYINSWDTTIIEVNGVNLTNQFVSNTSFNFPDKVDGNYFIRFISTVAWGHFEAGSVDDTPNDVEIAFENCDVWKVNTFSINILDLLGVYIGHEFSFNNDGTVVVTSLLTTNNGTWVVTGTQEDGLFLTIDIPGLSDFSDTWTVNNVDLEADTKTIELTAGNKTLTFESDCIND